MKRAWPISARFLALGFVPIGLALVTGFYWFRAGIQENVRGGLQQTLADAQQVQTNLRLDARQQRLSLLATLAENASLKAVLTLAHETPGDLTAQLTVQEHMLDMASSLDADLVGFRNADGHVVTAISREGSRWKVLPTPTLPPSGKRMAHLLDRWFDLLTVPVNSGPENLGTLVVGKRFDPQSYHRQAVLFHQGRLAAKAGIGLASAQVEGAFAACNAGKACAITLDGAPYLALPVDAQLLEDGFRLWTLHSIEQTSSQLLGTATNGFWAALVTMLAGAMFADIYGARAVTRPLVDLIDRLRSSERSGILRGDFPETSSTEEVNELARAFNLAARSVAESQRRLDETYLQITQTMAQTLDARDPYTAGHSSRVSDYAVAIARAMNLSAAEIDIIRVGANLHDIGKIGIPDAVLQKPGPLTTAEFEVIKRHPVIGKRILEGVAKFRDYLSIVELHHENPDGSGYPWGLRGEQVPLAARIVHVVDAYDAMTSNRPYRQATQSDKAQEILRQNAGTQFDPAVVEVFLRLVQTGAFQTEALPSPEPDTAAQLVALEGHLEVEEKTRALYPLH
jgi:hypothetical protein